MRKLFIIALLLAGTIASAQTDEQKLLTTLKEFHQALVAGNTVSINQQTDKALSYGHSNGWVENKNDLLQHLESRYIVYGQYREDSVQIGINGNLAHARFIADINVTLQGSANTYRLKVLEVWVRKGKRWVLFARQAVKA